VNATTRELGADNLGARGQLREGGTGD